MHEKILDYPNQSSSLVIIGKESRLRHGGWTREKNFNFCVISLFSTSLYLYVQYKPFLVYLFLNPSSLLPMFSQQFNLETEVKSV